MMDLFFLYKYAFVLCFLASIVLGIQGLHLVARGQSLQILALSQGALLGNLIGRLIFENSDVLIIAVSLLFFIFIKFLFLSITKTRKKDETFFIVIYLSLLALSYLIISIFPGLEGHMSIGFFGDIVSLSKKSTFFLIASFATFIILYTYFNKKLLKKTFEVSVLKDNNFSIIEELLFASVFVCSLYGLGFLYSVSAMIFPAVLIGRNSKSFSCSLKLVSILSVISSVGGLSASISFERLSTVPTQIVLLLIFLLMTNLKIKNLKEVYNV